MAAAPTIPERPVYRFACPCGARLRLAASALIVRGRFDGFQSAGPCACPECGASGWSAAAGREGSPGEPVRNGTTCEPWADGAHAPLNGPEWSGVPVSGAFPDRWVCDCFRPVPEGSAGPCEVCALREPATRAALAALHLAGGTMGSRKWFDAIAESLPGVDRSPLIIGGRRIAGERVLAAALHRANHSDAGDRYWSASDHHDTPDGRAWTVTLLDKAAKRAAQAARYLSAATLDAPAPSPAPASADAARQHSEPLALTLF